jgi:peptidylprolyl isomerase
MKRILALTFSVLVLPYGLQAAEKKAAKTAAPAATATTTQKEPQKTMEQQPTKTASGLQYIDTVVGTGPMPKTGQRVTVHYTGTLKNGTKFDSSVDRGQPFTFVIGVGQVIRGWDEGVATMKVGGKRKLMIPPNLGYGERGAGNLIPPNSDLIFDVELLRLQ